MKLQNKLKSKDGASLLTTLLFFAICSFVSAVILAAASVNVSTLEKQTDEQQSYLALVSTAEIFRNDINDTGSLKYCLSKQVDTEYTDFPSNGSEYKEEGTEESGKPDNTETNKVRDLFIDAIDSIFNGNAWEYNCVVKHYDSGVEINPEFTVNVKASMDDEYTMVFTFSQDDSAYKILLVYTISERESIVTPSNPTEDWIVYGLTYKYRRTVTTKTYLTWDTGHISRPKNQ